MVRYIKLKSSRLLILISGLINICVGNYYFDFNYKPRINDKPRNVTIKQGVLQGVVVTPRINHALPPVEQYLGIPYAAPPTNNLRFMPPGSAPSWTNLKIADKFGPVCPQKFPDVTQMAPERKKYFLRLKKYLVNESEDCLYLNLYVPYQEIRIQKFPIMVFIHGESFEWNSGNPYDGSVLASYGKVIVVTLNYRLGVLGFLKAGIEETSRSNFGLLDQVAALLWIQENIAAFGGDPEFVTVFGHGTGAVCASLLMLSPMVQKEENKTLFQRAILMGGTALADWALAGNPRQVTYQVAQSLNCQIHDDLAQCLRNRNLKDIMSATAEIPPYITRFGPVVDGLVIPNDPKKSMTIYNNLFGRFELMYGVTEIESMHLLGPIALTHGMLEKERDHELSKYMRARFEMKPELYVTRTLVEYTDFQFSVNSEKFSNFADEPDRASMARDSLLDILSDARSVAPIILTARYHAAVNPQSYFYIFAHTTSSREYIRNKTYHGEELPYVFGVPLDGPRQHFTDHYTNSEKLFSEVIMTYISNFATTGDPNVPRKNEYLTLGPKDWMQFEIDWPEFDLKQERFLHLDIPPYVGDHYKDDRINFWNKILPQFATNYTLQRYYTSKPTYKTFEEEKPTKKLPFWFPKPISTPQDSNAPPNNIMENFPTATTVLANEDNIQQSSTMQTLLVAGAVFLVINIILFVGLYYKCSKLKRRANETKRTTENTPTHHVEEEKSPKMLWQMMKIRSPKSRDPYETVKNSDGSTNSKFKLARQMSSSTIDAHTKVRDWIAQEIVQKYSPRYLRRPRRNLCDQLKHDQSEQPTVGSESKTTGSNLTIGRTPTRPVSPADDKKTDTLPNKRPMLQKKCDKVSVAIDATPSGRGPSVLCQQPIELTKSLDYPHIEPPTEIPLRRSVTLEDVHLPKSNSKDYNVRKSSTNINLKIEVPETEIIKIEHYHSRSDPVQDVDYYLQPKKLKTFEPGGDINVTSRDEEVKPIPLTPEEALMTIKRRNFPKVLPDLPFKEALAHKRRSMPAPSTLFLPSSESSMTLIKAHLRSPPPIPPPRISSSPAKKPQCQIEPVLAEEPPTTPEPEVTYNNLYVGPLIPSKTYKKTEDIYKLTQPIYDNLNPPKEIEQKMEKLAPKTIVTTDPKAPIKRVEPKVIIKPNTSRNACDVNKSKTIPRVMAKDNMPIHTSETLPRSSSKDSTSSIPSTEETLKQLKSKEISSNISVKATGKAKAQKSSQIPTLMKTPSQVTNKESSSSESTPSEESDTGTVVKRV